MRFLLQRYPYHADIVDQHTGRTMARVYIAGSQPYPVLDDQGRFLIAVSSLDEAVPELERSYTEPPWQPVYNNQSQRGLPSLFIKRTPFGELRVQQDHHVEKWIAFRDGDLLLNEGKRATFGSCGAAQTIAVEYLRDEFDRSGNRYWSNHFDADYVDPYVDDVDRRIAWLFQRKPDA
jgi:hypothetical protein